MFSLTNRGILLITPLPMGEGWLLLASCFSYCFVFFYFLPLLISNLIGSCILVLSQQNDPYTTAVTALLFKSIEFTP